MCGVILFRKRINQSPQIQGLATLLKISMQHVWSYTVQKTNKPVSSDTGTSYNIKISMQHVWSYTVQKTNKPVSSDTETSYNFEISMQHVEL